jgi:hypothetical protein
MRVSLIVLLALVFVGCDPGWRYHLASSPGAASVHESEPIRIELVRASVFSLGLDVTVNVTNASALDVMIESVDLAVRDADDSVLPQTYLTGCQASVGARLRLSPATACEVSASFRVDPVIWWRANPRLRALSVRVTTMADNARVLNTLPLERDN